MAAKIEQINQPAEHGRRLGVEIKGTRELIFTYLLQGDLNAIELEKKLGINESAVRRHLSILEREGLVSPYFDRSSVGRPKKKYRLTQLGRRILPKKSDVLVALLTRRITRIYGKQALRVLMEGLSEDLAGYFLPHLPKDGSRRLKKMVKLFDEFGFFTSLSKRGEEYIITYRNCVFGDVIPELNGLLCVMHQGAVARILNTDRIKLEKCIVRGDDLCSQLVLLDKGT
ncbi:helix-turn-helix transcriptional regulator [Candidatus Hecatella orcuttiae]|jgi:predicted ArsR family transcriptional regulator|uniref:helix-turn-helix transcriptional regulator n=1 Tax=Candidatus Hecatella orcuttiae TaxID=1935119 RepID=UPI002867F0D1|nr:ArsR family transcriptional regulator [Candidatus Hecatella orcuttiae]